MLHCTFLLLMALTVGWCGQQYRFDYEWSEQAGGWLKYHAVPAVWDEARLRCHAEGAVLASPLTHQLKAAIISFALKQASTSNEQGVTIFSGVHSTFSKGDYSSIEGVPLLRLAATWAPGEPDNCDNSENCLEMIIIGYHNGLMADKPCDKTLPYVCYKKGANLTITECGTADPAYILQSRTGSCYKYHKIGLIWSEAYMTCVAEGGYLAIIDDDVEADVIKHIMSENPDSENFGFKKDQVMIGFHDWGHRGASFMTIHGETLKHNMWSNGEPSNSTRERSGDSGEYCVSVFRNLKLNDVYCHVPMPFLCEKSPFSLL